MKISSKIACLFFALLLAGASFAQSLEKYDVDQTTGFRMERYRAPVPADIPDAVTINMEQAIAMLSDDNVVFIDVYPPKGLGPDPLDGHWVITEKRQSIPGSIWLPEVGRGWLQPDAQEYFARNLNRMSEGDKSKTLVFFCTADCWQSWNAARRATMLGYTGVHWFPLGSDGWLENGKPLTRVYPVNFMDDTLDIPQDEGG